MRLSGYALSTMNPFEGEPSGYPKFQGPMACPDPAAYPPVDYSGAKRAAAAACVGAVANLVKSTLEGKITSVPSALKALAVGAAVGTVANETKEALAPAASK